ncbi:hypothetical protein PGT21_019413, partial [Puccinia graminis f. sp. tritici]
MEVNHQSRHAHAIDFLRSCSHHPSCFFQEHRKLGPRVIDWPASSLQPLLSPRFGQDRYCDIFTVVSSGPAGAMPSSFLPSLS